MFSYCRESYRFNSCKRSSHPQGPPPVACGLHGDVEILCGTRSPEDLELTPDGNYLIVSQFVNGRGGTGAGLVLFNLAKKSYGKIAITSEPKKDWGDPKCPGPIGEALVPHGISLAKESQRRDPALCRQSWRSAVDRNVRSEAGRRYLEHWPGTAAFPTDEGVQRRRDHFRRWIHRDASDRIDARDRRQRHQRTAERLRCRWTPGRPEAELPGTRQGYPNGVLVSPNGRFMYYNAWTNLSVHKYDLKKGADAGVVKLDFMPDNITLDG